LVVSNNRTELDPVTSTDTPAVALPPEARVQSIVDSPEFQARLDALIAEVAEKANKSSPIKARMVRELISSSLKLIPDGRDTGELKLIAAAVKELRYAYRVFGQYPDPHKVTIFGSARTPKNHPDYEATVEFSRLIAAQGWMVITGAGGGIMEAGHVGPGKDKSFGVAIRLPFEQSTNEVIAGDSKLITFRYFFTRKLMFISQAEAVALFPGGFGTMDEGFELLTLVQTGKASMVPIVMCQGKGESYWQDFDSFIRKGLMSRGWVSEEDPNLYHIAATPAEAAEHITRFYSVYHSSRYVRDDLVIRLKHNISAADVDMLNTKFAVLVKEGKMAMRSAFDVEEDHRDLPRLVFAHNRRNFGTVRQLIDAINECKPPVVASK